MFSTAAAGREFEEGRPGWHIYEAIAPRSGEPVIRKHMQLSYEVILALDGRRCTWPSPGRP